MFIKYYIIIICICVFLLIAFPIYDKYTHKNNEDKKEKLSND